MTTPIYCIRLYGKDNELLATSWGWSPYERQTARMHMMVQEFEEVQWAALHSVTDDSDNPISIDPIVTVGVPWE